MSNQEQCGTSPAVVSVYQSWNDIRDGLEPGEVIHVEKGLLPHPGEAGLRRTSLTLKGWTRAVYNDTRDRHSLRVYDYGPYYKATVVSHNPDTGWLSAARHAVKDAPTTTALAVALGYGVYKLTEPTDNESEEQSNGLLEVIQVD